MANHSFEKYYLAILHGNLNTGKGESGTLDARIARKAGSLIEREINPAGQTAITHYKLIQNYADFCLVEFQLETGRTHQIRVHSKSIGHPIWGDSLYGIPSELIDHQALHAYKISFFHPTTHTKMNFYLPLPEDMNKILKNEKENYNL